MDHCSLRGLFFGLTLVLVGVTGLSFYLLTPSLSFPGILLPTLLAGLIGGPLAFLFYRAVLRPLRSLQENLERIQEGNLQTNFSADRRDIFGQLGRTLRDLKESYTRSIREVRQERDELTAILDEFGQGVVAVDEKESIVYMNPEAARLLETDREEALERPLYEVARTEKITSAVSETLETGRTKQVEINRVQPRDEQIIDVTTSPLTGNGDQLRGAVIALNDVTELHRLQTVRQDFVANVSHELKTPLAAIQGLVDTLLEDGEMDAETRRRFTEKIRNQISRMTELTEDLLTISRLESTEENLTFETLDLRTPVKEAVKTVLHSACKKDQTLNEELPDEPLSIRGDSKSLQHLVQNLLDNAVKYTQEGGSITVRVEQKDGEYVLDVEDDGYGIEPRQQERIFERFYRVDEGRSRDQGGTGLGLSIVKHVARSHGGSIELESTPGQGSRFRIRLPTQGS